MESALESAEESPQPSVPNQQTPTLSWLGTGAVSVGIAVAAVAFGWGPIADMDTWLHLSMGRWMVENRAVMTADPWTFTENGARVIPHEWLYQILQYIIYNTLGPQGLAGFRVLQVAGILGAVLLHGRSLRASTALVFAFAVVALYIGLGRLVDRPHLLTFAFVPLLAALLEYWRRTPTLPLTAAIVALFWIWGQCHGGVLYGLAVLGVYAAEGLARNRGWLLPDTSTENLSPQSPPSIRAWGGLALVCLITPMLGPAGASSLLYAVETLGKLRSVGLQMLEFFQTGDGPLHYVLLVMMAVATLGLLFAGGRRSPRHGVLLLLFVFGSVGAVRDRTLWFLLAAAPVARLVDQLLSHRPVKVRRTLNAAVVALALAMMVTIIPGRQWDVTRPAMAQILPDGALNQLQAIRPGENRVFVPDYMGAYLNWLHPGKNRPFLDARMDAWSPALLRDHISAMLDTSPTIRQEILDRRGVEALVLDYPGMVATLGIAPGLRATAFDPQGPWALVWWDDRAMLFLRRTIAEQRDIPILDLVNPANPGQAIDRAIATLQPGTSQSLLIDSTAAELRRVLEISPENVFAGRLLGYLLARAGRYSEAADAFSETIQRANRRSLPPVRSDYEAWVGTLRDAGRRDEADRAALEMARRFSSP